MSELKGRISLVTGGSRGIGRATVEALAQAGADVAFTYQRSAEKAAELTGRLEALGVRAMAIQADSALSDPIRQAVARIHEAWGPISILVNNAGITRDRSFLRMTREMWDEVLAVNLSGLFAATQAVLPKMIESGWGRIITVSSIVGQTGNFGQTNYAASKAGAIGFTQSLAREVARKGITVNAVAPGFIETDMTANVPAAALDQVKAMTPAGRLGRPEEIAHAIVFLASPRADYITGQVLAVNGGMYM